MTTSPRITPLPAPKGDEPLPRGQLAYLRARYQSNVHSIVLEEFEKSGLTMAQLARRLRMDPGQLARLMGNPSNMTLDTLSDLLYAISGKEPDTRALPFGEMDRAKDAATTRYWEIIAADNVLRVNPRGHIACYNFSISTRKMFGAVSLGGALANPVRENWHGVGTCLGGQWEAMKFTTQGGAQPAAFQEEAYPNVRMGHG